MLRPGTEIPSPSTVSRDVRAIFEDGSIKVKEYFEVAHALHHFISDICNPSNVLV
jgi:hypothetical protein